jgi:hypothetical protein
MSTTRTGNFTIGFRRGWSDWQKDLGNVIAWAKENNFGAIDLGKDSPETVKQVLDAGLKVGTLDLQEWNTMLSPDAGKRKEAIAKKLRANQSDGAAGFVQLFRGDAAGKSRAVA